MSDLIRSVAHADLPGLADIVMPAPPAWWPQTPGWWILAACLAAALLVWAWRARRRYRANRYRREALAELGRLQAALAGNAIERGAALLAVAALLKRTALAAWPRASVAPLSGLAWRDFLHAHAGRAASAVPVIATLVCDAEYRGADALDAWPATQAAEAAAACGQWIAAHQAP
jgi:hypothetical protein